MTARRAAARRKAPSRSDMIEDAIRRAGSIGELERLAGIATDPAARQAFWQPFCRLPGAKGLDVGVAELKCRIRLHGPARSSEAILPK